MSLIGNVYSPILRHCKAVLWERALDEFPRGATGLRQLLRPAHLENPTRAIERARANEVVRGYLEANKQR